MYRPAFILIFLALCIFLNSCAPAIYPVSKDPVKTDNVKNEEFKNGKRVKVAEKPIIEESEKSINYKNSLLASEISIILPLHKQHKITEQFINTIELAVYQKKIKNLSFSIDLYENSAHLKQIINNKSQSGKIFIGPLDSSETSLLRDHCESGVIFLSFAPEKNLAEDCIFLINFFPENELSSLFNNFPVGSKIALLYPENSYGYNINQLIDQIAERSDSLIVNRASYSEDLSNVRDAIKELGKYELRKYELDRQKKILASKSDTTSIKRLKKLNKFQTTKDFDFTHILLPDYGIRLLQVAPLLPYYDVDPNVVQFVGTGVWDDPIFFTEPSLQKAIFPGVELNKRKELIKQYEDIYEEKLMRTTTLPYDVIGLLSYAYKNNMTLNDFYNLLNDSNIRFDGIDGKFYFKNNIIKRDLDILQIINGKAVKIN